VDPDPGAQIYVDPGESGSGSEALLPTDLMPLCNKDWKIINVIFNLFF
jgi:hypothetical protein